MTGSDLRAENDELKARLEEAEDTLRAIRSGAVDAVVVGDAGAPRVYTLDGADRAYRVWVEQMSQGAATLSSDGTVAYCNPRLAMLLGTPCEKLAGRPFGAFVTAADHFTCAALLRDARFEAVQAELLLSRADGSAVPVLLTVNPLPLESGAALGVLVTDLTAQKRHDDLASAMAALKESERMRHLALDSAELGAWHVETGTMALTTDERFRAIFGVAANHIDYADAVAVIHPDDQVRVRDAVAAATRPDAPAPYAVEYRVIRPDGEVRWVFAKGRANFEGGDGQVGSFDGTLADITDRKRSEEERELLLREVLTERERLASVFQYAPSFMCVLRGPEHVFERANARYYQLVGHRDIIGKPVREAIPEVEGQGFFELLDAVYRTGEPFTGTDMPAVLQRRPGDPPEERFIDLVFQPLRGPDGAVIGILAQGLDQTDRKRAGDTLRQLAADLSEAGHRKDEFLATLAHELRNPLAPIRNGLSVLRMGDRTEADGKLVRMMERQLEQLVHLVDDLLDVSRVTSGKVILRTERVELRTVAAAAVETSRPLFEQAGHDLTVSLPEESLPLDGDRTRLAQVLTNLLTNAAKYTPNDGRVELSAARDGDHVAIRVTDSGLGISQEMLPKVFDVFTQVRQSLDRSQGGLGLGLTLVRRLVEMHGGTVAAESPGLGRGSTFTVRLPLALTHAPAPGEPTQDRDRRAAVAPRRILVVDDNVDGAESLAMLLELSGHEIRTAHSGPAALAEAEKFRPEVVLLDIGLPGMNGYEVAQRLRRDAGLAGAVLVALTGWGSEDDRKRSQEAGFDFHLTKPVETERLEELLGDLPTAGGEARQAESFAGVPRRRP